MSDLEGADLWRSPELAFGATLAVVVLALGLSALDAVGARTHALMLDLSGWRPTASRTAPARTDDLPSEQRPFRLVLRLPPGAGVVGVGGRVADLEGTCYAVHFFHRPGSEGAGEARLLLRSNGALVW